MKGDLGQRWVVAEDSVGSGGMLGCRMGRRMCGNPMRRLGKGWGLEGCAGMLVSRLKLWEMV